MHTPSVLNFKKLDCIVSKACQFKRDFTALLLPATLEPFMFFQYIIIITVSDGG